jgi:hypothetical protein
MPSLLSKEMVGFLKLYVEGVFVLSNVFVAIEEKHYTKFLLSFSNKSHLVKFLSDLYTG